MFKIFRRRKDKPAMMYGVFQRIGQAIERKQRVYALFLNRKAQHITGRRLLIALVLFCIGFGGGAVYVMWQSLVKPSRTVAIKFIAVPRHAIPEPVEAQPPALLSAAEIARIRQFQHYLDSLQRSADGKIKYDSIQKYRPGLLDSLAFIQTVYQEQLKTK